MESPLPDRRRMVRRVLLPALIAVPAVYMVLPVALGIAAILPAGGHATVWTAPQAGHTEAFSRYPGEYERRVIAFFDAALPGESGTTEGA